MSNYKLETRSLFLRLLEKIFLIGVMMMAFSPLCYGFQWEGMTITPSITSTTEYNDNIAYDEEVAKEDDVINHVNPGLHILVPGKRAELELSYEAGFEFFAMNHDLNDVTHAAKARARIQPLEHMNFTLTDDFYRGSDVGTIDILGLGIRRARDKFWTNDSMSSLEYIFSPDLSLKLNYENRITKYDKKALLADSNVNNVNPVLTYRIGHSIFILDYTYTHQEFQTEFDKLNGHLIGLGYEYRLDPRTSILASSLFAHRNFTGPVSDYIIYDFLVGLRRDLTSHLSITARGGYLLYDPEGMEEANNFVGNCTLTYTAEKTRIDLIAEAGYEEVFTAIENLGYASSWEVSGSLSHALHRFWRVELRGLYGERDYKYRTREDRYWTGGAALVYEPVPWFTAEVRYEHEGLDVFRGTEPSYKLNRVMLTLQLRY